MAFKHKKMTLVTCINSVRLLKLYVILTAFLDGGMLEKVKSMGDLKDKNKVMLF